MGLRLEQKMQLLQLRRQLMETMSTLLQERRMIQALIKASLLFPQSRKLHTILSNPPCSVPCLTAQVTSL